MCQKQLGLGNESKDDAMRAASSENHRPICPLDFILSALLDALGYFFRPFRIIIGKMAEGRCQSETLYGWHGIALSYPFTKGELCKKHWQDKSNLQTLWYLNKIQWKCYEHANVFFTSIYWKAKYRDMYQNLCHVSWNVLDPIVGSGCIVPPLHITSIFFYNYISRPLTKLDTGVL